MKKMFIWDWFDIKNKEHLKAYRHLQDTGMWPRDFLPEGLKLGHGWQIILKGIMAAEYVREKLND